MTYTPPDSIWEVGANIRFDEPLDPGDERYVATEAARGQEFSFGELLRQLSIHPQNWKLMAELKDSRYILFCGHRGCGKSTELRRLARKLNDPERFFVVELDALKELDVHNLQYTDVLMGLAGALMERLMREEIRIDPVFSERLEKWFTQRIQIQERVSELKTEIAVGVEAEGGIPLLFKLFGKVTNAFKVGATYKEELRNAAKNHFSEFAEGFNLLLREAERQVRARDKGQRILLVVDGADRLNQEDSHRFFVADAYQLQSLHGLYLYCAPIHLIYEHGAINQVFPRSFKLPMIKLAERDGTPIEEGYAALRELIYRRAAPRLFDAPETVDYLITHSGGHPRDLLRLLVYAHNAAEGELFDHKAAERAVKQLANDYRRLLSAEDYDLLARIDRKPDYSDSDDDTRELLYNLALLEYNAYWWRSHPAIQTLPAYQAALASLPAQP